MGKVVNVAPDTHEHIPRPANAWILFRRSRVTSLDGRPRQADCSKTLSNEWNAMPEEEKMPWRVLADQEKKKHKLRYPNYVYTPKPRKKKTTGKGKGRGSSSSTSSDRASSFSLEPEEGPVTEPSFSFPSTRAIVPIDSSASSSSQHERPLGSLEYPYEAPSEFGPPPSISTTLKGRQPWSMQGGDHIYPDYSSPSDYSPLESNYFSPPLCLDPQLFSPNPAGLQHANYMAPQPIVMTGEQSIDNQAGIIPPMPPPMPSRLDQQAGPSSPSHPPPGFGPPLYAPSLAHEESVLLEALCRQTADYLAATRLPPGGYSPPLGGAYPTSFASNPALLPALFEMMAGMSRSVSL